MAWRTCSKCREKVNCCTEYVNVLCHYELCVNMFEYVVKNSLTLEHNLLSVQCFDQSAMSLGHVLVSRHIFNRL